jgi:preprotein translocase subunit YajC
LRRAPCAALIQVKPGAIIRRFFPLQQGVLVFLSSAYAQAPGNAGGDASLVGFLPIILMFVLLYFLMIRPQMKRAKEHKQMVEALQKGDEVLAAGGLLGRITGIGEAYVSLEIAPNTEISVQKTAVQTLLPKGTIKSVQ